MKQICITKLCAACETLKTPEERLHVGDICTLIEDPLNLSPWAHVIKPNGIKVELCFLYRYKECNNITLANYAKQGTKG